MSDHQTETRAPAAAGDGFVTYDELAGPDLAAARWSPARLPLPTGGEHIPLDPNAELAVGEGEVRAGDNSFSLAHSAKYLIFSTRQSSCRWIGRRRSPSTSRWRTLGGEPDDTAWDGRLRRLRPRREHARVLCRRHLHPRVRDA